ncbi:MAG: hypothetical protein AB7K09_23985 [Planctomycetota bacterium]
MPMTPTGGCNNPRRPPPRRRSRPRKPKVASRGTAYVPWEVLVEHAGGHDPRNALDALLDLLDDPTTPEDVRATIRDWLDS